MKTQLLGLLAETSIHPGAGQSSGVIDLPVAREAATDYPVVPGSSLKGALFGLARQIKADGTDRMAESERKRIFGEQDNAGALLASDVRLLLLPVRSLSSAYKWVTCPHLLERFARDRQRGSVSNTLPKCDVTEESYLGKSDGDLFLEERQFSSSGPLPNGLVDLVSSLLPQDKAHANTRTRLPEQLVILHDKDFAWFARHGLAVQARNRLDAETKTTVGGALWYEETIPPDALFYTLLAERQSGALAAIAALFKDHAYLQVGGNETVGMGWFAVALPDGKEGAA